jgi:hypothetical protein
MFDVRRAAVLLEFEVLHHVRHIDIAPLDARLRQCTIQDGSGGSHERVALQILLVARNLAH